MNLKINFKYCKVSNRRGKWNSRGGWKKYQKLIVQVVAIVEGWSEENENFNSRKGVSNCFFLSFSNHLNYGIKNFCVYSKSEIKTKVTRKQNIEQFKMINRRLFIRRDGNNENMLLSSSRATFITAFVFWSSPSANFSSFEYLRFSFLLIFRFILI